MRVFTIMLLSTAFLIGNTNLAAAENALSITAPASKPPANTAHRTISRHPMTSLPASPHAPEPLDSESSIEKLLTVVSLGSNVHALRATIGDPLFVARENHYWYWTYSVDNGHGWFIVTTSKKGVVESTQVVPRADTTSFMHDANGVHFGDSVNAKHIPTTSYMSTYLHGQPDHVTAKQASHRFYGMGRDGHVERIGVSIGDMTLPLIVRWYRYDGESPSRAIPFSAYSGIGESAFVKTVPDRYIPCSGGNTWNVIATRTLAYAGTTLDEVQMQCGDTALRHTRFFNRTMQAVHGYDADPIAQKEIAGSFSPQAMKDAISAQEIVDRNAAKESVGATTGQLWFTSPNAVHCSYVDTSCDPLLAYIDDPANPLDDISLIQSTTPTSTSLLTLNKTTAKTSSTVYSCSFSGGLSKCGSAYDFFDNSPDWLGYGDFNGNPVYTDHHVASGSGDPIRLPHPAPCDGKSGKTGLPIDVVSGALSYQQEDAALSGPGPLRFFHRYQSTFAQGAVPGGPKQQRPTDLGVGWRHMYDAYIDLSYASYGLVTVNRNDCGLEYFQISSAPGTSATSYDPNSGNTLFKNADYTYTLVTWDHRTMEFDGGALLSSITDRVGNVQTISRNTDETISSVTDGLGRSFSFTYDTSKRITNVTSIPSGVSLTFSYDSGTNCYTGELCSTEESDGKTWTYQYYDPSTNGGVSLLKYVIDPLGHTEEYNQYTMTDLGNGDDHYRVTQQQRASGHETRSFTYTGGNPGTTTITDSLGSSHTTTYTWDRLLQQVLSVQGPLCECNGNALSYTYDIVGRMRTVTEGTGTSAVTRRMTYGRDTTFTSPDGLTSYLQNIYPSVTKLERIGLQTQGASSTVATISSYYPLGDTRQDLAQTVTEPSVDTPANTVTTTNTYSTTGLLTAKSRQGYINGSSTTYAVAAAYDAKGRVTSTTGPRTDLTQTTSYAYYPDTDTDLARRGQLYTITDPASHVTTYAGAASPYNSYTIYGEPQSVTDVNGVVTDMTYDGRGRVLTTVLKGVTGDTADLTTTYAYDDAGKLTSVNKPLLNGKTLVYDTNNNLTNTILTDTTGLQHDQSVGTFDTMDRLTAHTLQSCTTPASTCAAWSTEYSDAIGYTDLDQQQSLSYPTGGATTYTYDGTGNLTSQNIGDAGYSVTDTYGSDAQHQSTLHGLGGSTLLYASDLQFNTASVAPSNATPTTDQHDDFGRLEKRTSPFSGVATYAYDPAGNLTSKTDGNAATTATTYDVLNRPLVATSTRTGKTTETVTNTYDDATTGHFGIGRLASMTDPSGSTTYAYERRGKIASQVQVANGTTFTTTTTYDGNGNRSTVTLPSTRVLTYAYDYADRPSSVGSGTTTYVSSASYKPFGPLAQLTFGNGTTQTKSFNQRYLLTENNVVSGATSLSDVTYNENATGYITNATDALNAGYNQAFQYGGRATNMLTQATTGSSLWGTASYADTYNQNLSSVTFPGNSYGLTYNRSGVLTSLYNSDTGTSQTVAYDGAGNELTVGASSYAYSSRNYLNSGDGVTYTYDGMGQRVSATAIAGTRTSLYDTNMHLQMETGLASGAVAYDYVWFAGIPVAQEDLGGNTHWTVTDYRNTPFMQTTSAGAVYWQADYAPFGAVYALRTSDAHQPLRMPGQEAEEFTSGNANGLTPRFYNGFRWYRPLLGRYTQSDPIGYNSGSFNLYSYAANNPHNVSDAYGLAVYLGEHPYGPGYHSFIVIVPSDGGPVSTISAGPAGYPGHLTYQPNADLDSNPADNPGGGPFPLNPGNLVPISPPTGTSGNDFENGLINSALNYQDSTPVIYGMLLENSNSFTAGILFDNGILDPAALINQTAPGGYFPGEYDPIVIPLPAPPTQPPTPRQPQGC